MHSINQPEFIRIVKQNSFLNISVKVHPTYYDNDSERRMIFDHGLHASAVAFSLMREWQCLQEAVLSGTIMDDL